MTKRVFSLGVLLVAVAMLIPTAASAAPAVPMKCDVSGSLPPTLGPIARGTIKYVCASSLFGTSPATCTGTITGTTTAGTCSIGMLTVVRCEFSGSFITGGTEWKGALKIACGLPGTPPPRIDCYGEGRGAIATTGAFKGTLAGYCQRPGLA